MTSALRYFLPSIPNEKISLIFSPLFLVQSNLCHKSSGICKLHQLWERCSGYQFRLIILATKFLPQLCSPVMRSDTFHKRNYELPKLSRTTNRTTIYTNEILWKVNSHAFKKTVLIVHRRKLTMRAHVIGRQRETWTAQTLVIHDLFCLD